MSTQNSCNYAPTQYNVQTGGASGALNNVAPSATSGNPLVSAGSASQPIFSATPTVTSITISNAPSAGTDGTNKTYVDAAVAAVNPATSVTAATTAALTVTYNNGVSGIGATLTNAGAQAAFSIDGQSPAITSRVLIKNQASAFQNGVYTVTIIGTGATNWVLTRALDYDQPSDINNTGIINVLNGTVNAGTGWLINSTVTTVGTDAITYTQFTYPASFFLQVANNLSDVASAATSRTNLGLTAVATQTVTNHDVLVGGSSNAITSVAPSATSGIPLVSNGSSSDPSFTTALVAGGGTGVTSTTAYAVLCGGTTSTGALQSIAGVGTSGQVLTSNGAGALPTFQAASGGSGFTSIAMQSFTSSGTYTPTSGMLYCIIEVQGGGGGGGGGNSSGAEAGGGGGGGAGGYSRGVFTAATIGASQTVTINTGGGGNSNAAGSTGGSVSVGALISANGGNGGAVVAATAASVFAAGGTGGTATGGTINITGGQGDYGLNALISGSSTYSGYGGRGADSMFGKGGPALGGSSGNQTAGKAASGFGAGGGGCTATGSTNVAGGSGTNGIVVVTEFI